MIIIRMSGGLGNQMFQYALYLQLQALGREVRIDDTTEYTEVTADGKARERRPRMLGTAFGIDYPRATAEEITQITDSAPGLAAKVRRKVCGRHSQEIRDRDFIYDPAFLEYTDGYYCGCYQSARYSAGVEDAVRKAYTFTDAVVAEVRADAAMNQTLHMIAQSDAQEGGCACAVHLRFGDYLDNPGKYGNICTDAYYEAAMAEIVRDHPNVAFYLFSNDPDKAQAWADQRSYHCVIVRGSDEAHGYRDLYLMSRCHHYIIANSSYSWWGAFLGAAQDKRIYAPSYWVRENDGTQLQRQDIYTDDMIRINPDGVLIDAAGAVAGGDETVRDLAEQAHGKDTGRNQNIEMDTNESRQPLVSVIVAAYNIEQYLPRALDSLVNQTLQDLEIVVVDDGSTDATPQIADDYAVRDARIKVLHKENGGLSDARNAGLAVATGQYIGFLDGDDWVEPAMYEAMVQGCLRSGAPMACVKYQNVTDSGETATGERNQTLFTVAAQEAERAAEGTASASTESNAEAAGADIAAVGKSAGDAGAVKGGPVVPYVSAEEAIAQSIVLPQDKALDVYVSNGLNGNETKVIIFNSVWSKLFRRDLIEGMSFPKGKNSEDIMWTTRCLCKAASVCYLPVRFYNYLTDRKDSIMNVQRGERRLNDEIPFWLEHIECLKEKGFEEAAEKAEYYFYRRMLFYAADFHAREGMESYARDIERMMKGHGERVMKVMSHASYGSKGDVARMRLFLANPKEYYAVAGLYEKTVVAIKNL